MFYQLQVIQIVMRTYHAVMKGKLACLSIKKTNFFRKQWACVSTNTQKFTPAVKGKQRK